MFLRSSRISYGRLLLVTNRPVAVLPTSLLHQTITYPLIRYLLKGSKTQKHVNLIEIALFDRKETALPMSLSGKHNKAASHLATKMIIPFGKPPCTCHSDLTRDPISMDPALGNGNAAGKTPLPADRERAEELLLPLAAGSNVLNSVDTLQD